MTIAAQIIRHRGGIDEVFAGFAMTAAAVTGAFFLLQKIQFDEVLGSCMHHQGNDRVASRSWSHQRNESA
jgi:hypothetical protein